MALATPANWQILSMLTISLPVYSVYHAYKFDRCRCLLPRRGNRIRATMLWLLHASTVFFVIWSVSLCELSYRVGFVVIPDIGTIPTPSILMSNRDIHRLLLSDIYLVTAFSLYDAVNLEEALYWIFLIRSVHNAREGRLRRIERWASSRVFHIYVVLAILSTIGHVGAAFFVASGEGDRTIRIFLAEGASTMLNVFMSGILAWYLPPFTKAVAHRGGSPEVIRKLVTLEEMNMLRLICRTIFAGGCFALSIDATTETQTLVLNRFASDVIFMLLYLAFWLGFVISIMLYLPISYSKTSEKSSSTVTPRRAAVTRSVVASRRESHKPERETPFALMSTHSVEHKALVSLLRERGTIGDDEQVPEDELFYELEYRRGGEGNPAPADHLEAGGAFSQTSSAVDRSAVTSTFEDTISVTSPTKTVQSSLSRQARTLKRLSDGLQQFMPLPDSITQFAGPFGGVPGEHIPREVVIRVEQDVEVNEDEGGAEDYRPGRRSNRDPMAEEVARALERRI